MGEVCNLVVRCAGALLRNGRNVVTCVSHGADNSHIDAFVGQEPHRLRCVAGLRREHYVFTSDDISRTALMSSRERCG